MPNMANFVQPPEGSVTAVAIDKDDKNSHYAVKWVVDNLDLVKRHGIVLVHVTQNNLPHKDMVPITGGTTPNNSELQKLFIPYRGFCARNKIHSTEMVLHDLDVARALVEFIKENSVATIVLGASNRGAIERIFKSPDVPTTLTKLVPEFCSVFVASKAKINIVKTANRSPPSYEDNARKMLVSRSPKARDPNRLDDWYSATSDEYSDDGESSISSPSNSMTSPNNAGVKTSRSHVGKPPTNKCQSPQHLWSPGSPSPPRGQSMTATEFLQTCNKPERRVLSPLRKQSHNANNPNIYKISPLPSSAGSSFPVSGTSSWNSSKVSFDQTDDSVTSFASSVASLDQDEEIKRLRYELQETMEMYKEAHNQVIAAKMKVQEIHWWKSEKVVKREENIWKTDKQNRKATVKCRSEGERVRIQEEAEEKKRSSGIMTMSGINYRRYSIEEIEIATDYLSPERKIGEGGYGPVYKGYLDYTFAAIKVLRHDMLEGRQQFDKEIEVLSCMRHPNLVLLLGACPEYGCLAYEYMENGSLEDRLFRVGNTPPIPWKIRFKIAAEIASGLYFLHNAQPLPLVHRDLKPANILLDRNLVSKIGDVGLSRMVPTSSTDGESQYCLTAAAGTFCYIDPEYQQTGRLETKSDIYSLGIILLQILTAKAPMGLAYTVENAIESGKFEEILDPSLKDWPVEEALALAKLGLQCCELRKKDRPDLDSVIQQLTVL